jgi:hypothetical protein
MPERHTQRRLLTALPLALLASLVLAACGGSSASTSTSAAASSATGAAGATGAARQGVKRFAALRECLEKNGVILPAGKAGARPKPGTGGFLGGGPATALPKGVTRARYLAALKKCGGAGFFGGARRFNSPARTQALTKFAACMRHNGINLPSPNTTGSGPIFNTKSVNTTSTAFKAAERKCASDLAGAFRRPPAAGGATPPA